MVRETAPVALPIDVPGSEADVVPVRHRSCTDTVRDGAALERDSDSCSVEGRYALPALLGRDTMMATKLLEEMV